MAIYKRALGVCVLLLGSAFPACAFTFSYGNLFDVSQVKNENGAVMLPLANGKYRNIKLLSKDVWQFIKQCRQDCTYEVTGADFTCTDYRKAATREGMMIAEVEFNGEIQLTFLVFKNKEGFSVKFPADVQFWDRKLAAQVRRRLQELAAQIL